MPDMLSIGESMIELFSEEPMDTAETFTRSVAGDSLNIIVAASRLGTNTGYITKLGNDPFEGYLIDIFTSEGIDTTHVLPSDGFNAVHFVTVMPDGDREFVYYRAGSAPSTIKPEELNPEYISGAKIMHCSGIAQAISPSSRATVLAAAQIAQLNGVPVSYDPNYRHQLWNPSEAKEAMEELMPYVDIFLPSAPADSKVLFETEDPEKVIQEANRRGVETVVVTLGEDGALIGAENEVMQLDPMPAGPVIDTTGAGDSFKGGFIHGFLEGKSIAESALIGTVCAGITITGRGALNPMPYRKEVYDKVRNLR
jgi:2-dehydro-3-deoxygluconokinase